MRPIIILLQILISAIFSEKTTNLLEVAPKDLETFNFDDDIVYLLYFHSSDCQHCIKIKSLVEKLGEQVSILFVGEGGGGNWLGKMKVIRGI